MKDPIQRLFEGVQGELNTSEPNEGHFERFNARLTDPNKEKRKTKKGILAYIAIAASLFILVTFGLNNALKTTNKGLAAVSPEMNETHNYFSNLIAHELSIIEGEKTVENQRVIEDALQHIKILETEYSLLEEDLKRSGNNRRIIYAMVDNFQKRITILQLLIDQMEELKSQKKQKNNEKLLT